jgi:ABC-type nitrate/sulfonate/bicarbonate transport system substrate-binding protein
MTVATGVDPSFAPYYVAREGGFFQRNGLDGDGEHWALRLRHDRLPGRQPDQLRLWRGAGGRLGHLVDQNVVAVCEGTALLRWISVLGRGVESMDALKGKRVGVARGTGSETFWLSVVSKLNLNPADYTIVNVEAPEMVAALERGNIDAFAVWEPWPTRALRAIQGTKILLSNDQIQIVRNYVYMNRGWAEANAEATQRFMRSMVQAQEFCDSNPAEAAQQVARFLRQDRAFVAELMQKVGYRMNLTQDSVANIQLAIDQLRGMGRLAREVTPQQVIWPGALQAVAPDRIRI